MQKNDKYLGEPQKGEWLYSHKEREQYLSDYKALNPKSKFVGRDLIYIVPIGAFDSVQKEVIAISGKYLSIFFQREVKVLDNFSDSLVPVSAIRKTRDDISQIYAPYILHNILKIRITNDAIALTAVTSKDLYPDKRWNYVFGLASYQDKVSVTSMYRFHNRNGDSSELRKFVSRMIKVTSHEIGHILNLRHCILAKCLMNGSNTLQEIDSSPSRLCSECQKKINWLLKYDNKRRLDDLIKFFKEYGLHDEQVVLQKDLDLLK
ncbi:archaemetzincin [Parasegetibacter sp. NRK P23]|nr:archaemetzincin [Parasegetibacter sp. NRK P23]